MSCYMHLVLAEMDQDYEYAIELMKSGDYDAAITAFEELNVYKDSANQIKKCKKEKKKMPLAVIRKQTD